ncbi:MAG: OmpH family outer membrane protein [Deltaproteobacteria bacterium]|nr:OmpH family outer membrane protein [Deltaproteobacteria bacterium]
MFRKWIVTALVAALMTSAVVSTVQAAEKIALVSLQQALNEVNDGKKAKQKLKKDFESKKKQLDGMKSELEKLSQELDKQKMVLSGEALAQKRQDLQAKFIDLQNKAATYERELKMQEAESAKKILTSLREIVLEISKKEGYTLVIENSTDTVLYASTGEDITPKVIAEYNKK